MLLGLLIGILLMIFLSAKTKVHTFLALLLAALITGLSGMEPGAVINAIQDGFGNTLKSTGIIIGLGVMMGGVLEKTKAAERMAFSFIRLIGKGKEEWALGVTGWLVSIPVFADSAVVIFAPLCRAMSKVTGKSVVGLALALACGLQCTHVMVPPTPGPLTAAGMLGVDPGQMILFGVLMSIPIFIVSILYSKWVGTQIYQIPMQDGGYERKEYQKEYIRSLEDFSQVMRMKDLPPLWMALAPIVVPLFLILCRTVTAMGTWGSGFFYDVTDLLGTPIIALSIGTILAVYGLGKNHTRDQVLGMMNDSIRDCGMIMLITGAGGSLGNVIKVSGAGEILGEMVLDSSIPAVLIPVIIAALMRIALGSATVSITTAASLTAPLMPVLDVEPVLLAQACCIGAIAFSYFNDSGFWVFNGMFGLTDIKDQLKCKTAVSLLMTGTGVIELLILNVVLCS